MSYTFSITKNKHDPLLEINIKEEIIKHDSQVHSHLEKCFERVFKLIKQTIEKEDTSSEDGERNFLSIFK